MNIYEITNGFMGESYVKVYVWAFSQEQALEMGSASLRRAAELDRYGPEYWQRLRCKLLRVAPSAPMASRPTDSGLDFWGAE